LLLATSGRLSISEWRRAYSVFRFWQ
jgi:hypothetical protein